MALVKPLHNGVTPIWCAILRQRHAFGRISDLHGYATRNATKSHSAHRDMGGSCSSTSWVHQWQLIRRSNGSLHRFRAETQHSQMLYAEDVGLGGLALVKPLHYNHTIYKFQKPVGHNDKLHAAHIISQSRFAFIRRNILIVSGGQIDNANR